MRPVERLGIDLPECSALMRSIAWLVRGGGFDAKQLNPADFGDGAIPDTKDTIKGSRCEPYSG